MNPPRHVTPHDSTLSSSTTIAVQAGIKLTVSATAQSTGAIKEEVAAARLIAGGIPTQFDGKPAILTDDTRSSVAQLKTPVQPESYGFGCFVVTETGTDRDLPGAAVINS
jgi:hypothetical protein